MLRMKKLVSDKVTLRTLGKVDLMGSAIHLQACYRQSSLLAEEEISWGTALTSQITQIIKFLAMTELEYFHIQLSAISQ